MEKILITGGRHLGHDIPVSVAEDVITIGPAAVVVGGEERILARHVYAITPVDHGLIATAELVEVEGELRVRVVEERSGELLPEGMFPRDPAISGVATLWVPARAKTPDRVIRTVVTPGPPCSTSGTPTVREVLRPDLEPAEVERQRALEPKRRALQELRALQAAPLRAHRDGAHRDRILDILGRLHGLIDDTETK